jgi:hypothetical protein
LIHHKEQHGKKVSALAPPHLLEAFKITNWDEVQLHTMKFGKIKHMMLHPYVPADYGYDLTKMIEVEIEGEIKNKVPHGQCFLWFIYKGELKPDYKAPSRRASPSSPYLDGQPLTFRGTGMFSEGVLSGGSALFIDGYGCARSFSWMKDGRPSDGCQQRVYYKGGQKIAVTSKSTLTDVSGCIGFAGQIESSRDWQGQGKWFGDNGAVEEGIFKDRSLIDGRRWELNDDGSYQ